jgi:hypothetical protein
MVTSCNNRWTFGRGVICAIRAEAASGKNLELWVSERKCGGEFEYLQRSLANRRRRWKWNPVPVINWATLYLGDLNIRVWSIRLGDSRIWDSKIWLWVQRDLDSKMTARARTSSNCKRQIHRLVREGAPRQQTRNCVAVTKVWSWAPNAVRHQDRMAAWPSVVT